MTGNNRSQREGGVQAGPEKSMGSVLGELLLRQKGGHRTSPRSAYLDAELRECAAQLRDGLARQGLSLSTEELSAILAGRAMPMDPADFLTRVGRWTRAAKEDLRAFCRQCAFDIAVARLGYDYACVVFGWTMSTTPEAPSSPTEPSQ